MVFELQGMEPINDENKLQVDEKNKNSKTSLKSNNIINFNSFLYKVTALSNIFFSILNLKSMRPVSILRIQEELKKCKNSKFRKSLVRKLSSRRKRSFWRKFFYFYMLS